MNGGAAGWEQIEMEEMLDRGGAGGGERGAGGQLMEDW